MKALLIADDEKAITNISEVLKGAGYDVIVYKWLLKAMDNLEEIKPNLIVVSAKDYPRQWKTLAQYSTNLESDDKPQIILFSPEPLSDEELRKAETLQVRGIFSSTDSDGLKNLKEIINHKQKISVHENQKDEKDDDEGIITLKDLLPELGDLKSISEDIDSLKEELKKPFDINEAIRQLEEAQKEQNQKEKEKSLEAAPESDIIEKDENQKTEADPEPKDEKMNEEDIEAKLAAIMSANKADAKEKAEEAGIGSYSCSFVFTNPITLALVTGTARNYNGMTLEFMPDIPNFIMNLAPDTQISSASLKVNGEISDVRAEVMSNDAKKLYLQIKK